MKIFDLELASPCNATCDFCPQKFQGVKRKRHSMDVDLLDKVTGEIGHMARSEPIHVALCGMGENLLRKPLVLRALGNLERISGGRIFTLLVTNGSLLTEDLREHEAFRRLDAIQVSFTGFGKEAYEAIYGLDHARVVENVVAMNRKHPGQVYLRTVDLEELKPHRDAFVRFWEERGIRVTFRPMHSRGGHIADPEAYPGWTRPFAGCEIFDTITFVSSDGEVLSCCHDVESENVMGDCRVSTLAEIAARKRELQASRFPGFRICTRCTDFELAAPGRAVPEDPAAAVQSQRGIPH